MIKIGNDEAAEWVSPADLVPWERNPRRNDESVAAVARSIDRFGFGAPIVARREDRRIIAGHTRWRAAMSLGADRVPVRFLSGLDDHEAAALALADNRLTEATPWDTGQLADVLRELEAAQVDLVGLGWSDGELKEMLSVGADVEMPEPSEDEPEVGLSDEYTSKIVAPVYEPHGDRPDVGDLFDATKTAELVAEIEAAELPEDVRRFLVVAAQRHTVLDFRNIAEFYAHADAPLQRLMERSALVVIDFDDAIANGFVRMTKHLGALASTAHEVDDA